MAALVSGSWRGWLAGRPWRVLGVGVLLALASVVQPGTAQTLERPSVVERQMKATYLYKFANYVRWPANTFARTDSPIVIGVIGSDRMLRELQRVIRGKKITGRPLVARQLDERDSLAGVHILFLGPMSEDKLARIMASAMGHPVLVVSDSERALALGSMINFVMVDERLRFEVALKPVARNRLELSALMLTAAHDVRRDPF